MCMRVVDVRGIQVHVGLVGEEANVGYSCKCRPSVWLDVLTMLSMRGRYILSAITCVCYDAADNWTPD